jgi:hypothetical protein
MSALSSATRGSSRAILRARTNCFVRRVALIVLSLSGGEVEVHYHLTARVPRKFVDWEDKINLNFSPWRTELDVREESEKAIPTTCEPAHREYRLTQEGVPRPLTKSEAFKESFRTKSKPETKTVNFTLAAIAPTQIVIGKPYQLEIMVTSPNAEELGIVPEFRLKSYELNLKEKTDLRVPGVFMDHQTCLESHLPLTSSSKIDTVLPVNEMTKFNAMFPTHGAFPPPNFTSFAIRRRYVLELKAEVECFGERERYKIQWASVTLHPSRMEPGVEEAMRSIEAGTATLDVGMSERAVDVLPVYQPADGQDTLPRYEKHVEGSVLGL